MNLKNTLCTMPPWVDILCKAPLIFSNIFSDDLHVGTLIKELCLVCLITGQALGEGRTIQKVLARCWCVDGDLSWGVSLT